jgi:hypothetical protein
VQLLPVAKIINVCQRSARQSRHWDLSIESFGGVALWPGETARHTLTRLPGQIAASPQYYDKSEMTKVSDAQIALKLGGCIRHQAQFLGLSTAFLIYRSTDLTECSQSTISAATTVIQIFNLPFSTLHVVKHH